MSAGLDQAAVEFADSLLTEWPLEDMRGADLISAARRRIEGRLGLPTKLEAVDESIWMKVDSYSLMQAITYLVSRLQGEFGIREVRFGLEVAGQLAHLDLIWTGAPLGSETTMAWQTGFAGVGRGGVPAHAEADHRAAQRGDLVPDRQAVAARILSHRDAGHQAGGNSAGRSAGR